MPILQKSRLLLFEQEELVLGFLFEQFEVLAFFQLLFELERSSVEIVEDVFRGFDPAFENIKCLREAFGAGRKRLELGGGKFLFEQFRRISGFGAKLIDEGD